VLAHLSTDAAVQVRFSFLSDAAFVCAWCGVVWLGGRRRAVPAKRRGVNN
jgi:hypothetical protein